MIARVAIGPGLIRSLTPAIQPDDLAEFIDQHLRITDALLAHGKCLFSSETDQDQMFDAIRALSRISPDASKRWADTFTQLLQVRRAVRMNPPVVPDLDSISEPADLAGWKGRAAIAAVPSHQAIRLGVARSAASAVDPLTGVEIAKGKLLYRSNHLYGCVRLANHGVVANDSDRDGFFDQVLAPLARESKVVEICDRYLFTRLQRRNLRTGAPPEHVAWLLSRLADLPGRDRIVRLYGSIDPNNGPADGRAAAQLVRRHWGRPRDAIATVEVLATAWKTPSNRLPHDRHISFDAGAAIEIPAGFDRFVQARVKDADGVRWIYSPFLSGGFRKCRDERARVRKAINGAAVNV